MKSKSDEVNLMGSVKKIIPVIGLLFIANTIVISQQPSFRYNVEYRCGNERVVVRYCRNDSGRQLPADQNFCQVEFPDRPRRVAEIAVFDVILQSEMAARLQACSDPTAAGGAGTATTSAAANQALSRGNALIKAKDYSGAMLELKEAIRLDPRLAMAFHLVGIAQYRLKEYTVANAAFERALQLNVANPHAAYQSIGDCQRALGQHEKALSAYREAVRAKPDYADGFNGIGASYYSLKDFANAAIFFDQAARLDPKLPMYRKNTGMAYLGLGKKDEAMKVYNALVTVDPKLANELLDEISKPATAAAKARTPAETSFDNGWKFYGAKDYQKALVSFQEALRLSPGYGIASHHLGMTHYQLKQYPQAIAAFEDALKFKFSNPHFSHLWIGDTYEAQNQHAKAIAAYQEAVRLSPDYDLAFARLGNSNYSLKQYTEALAAYQAAIKLKPDNAVYHASAGDAYSKLKQFDKAITSYGEAVRIDPKYDFALNSLGTSHFVLEQYAAALPAFEQAVKLKPDNALYVMNLGDTYFELGRKADALAVHKKLATLDKAKADELFGRLNTTPVDPKAIAAADAAIKKGRELVDAKEYAKAIGEFQKAVAAKPNNEWLFAAHHWIGNTAISLRDWAQATTNLLAAARLNPTNAIVHADLGYVYERTLQFPKAVASYEEAIRFEKDEKKLNSSQAGLGKVYVLMGRRADAMAIYTKLKTTDAAQATMLLANIQQADKSGPAGVLAGDAFARELAGYSDDAVDIYQAALKLKPSPKVLMEIADGLGISGGKYAEGLALFRQVLTLKPSPDDRARAHYKIGQTLNFMKDYAKAIPEIREAQRLKADSDYSYELGESYSGLKQFPEALAAYQEAATLKPEGYRDSTIKLRMSETYITMGQPDKAIAYLESVAQNVENTAGTVSLELGKLYISSKRYPDAVTFLNKVIKVSPDYKEAYYQLARAYIAMGRKPDAMKTYVALRPLDMEMALKLLAEINAAKSL